MAVNDLGIITLGSFLKGDAPDYPTYMAFGTGSSAFNGSTYYLENEVDRKAITWTWDANWAKARAELTINDSNGSNIQEVGIGIGSVLGSDIITRDLSAIGDKDSSFSVTVNLTFKIARP